MSNANTNATVPNTGPPICGTASAAKITVSHSVRFIGPFTFTSQYDSAGPYHGSGEVIKFAATLQHRQHAGDQGVTHDISIGQSDDGDVVERLKFVRDLAKSRHARQ